MWPQVVALPAFSSVWQVGPGSNPPSRTTSPAVKPTPSCQSNGLATALPSPRKWAAAVTAPSGGHSSSEAIDNAAVGKRISSPDQALVVGEMAAEIRRDRRDQALVGGEMAAESDAVLQLEEVTDSSVSASPGMPFEDGGGSSGSANRPASRLNRVKDLTVGPLRISWPMQYPDLAHNTARPSPLFFTCPTAPMAASCLRALTGDGGSSRPPRANALPGSEYFAISLPYAYAHCDGARQPLAS